MKKSIGITLCGVIVSLAIGVAMTPNIFAKDIEESTPSTSGKVEPQTTKRSANAELRQEVERKKLDDKKKAVCTQHEEKINTRINIVTERSKNQFDRITTIYNATTAFSAKKGLKVENYDSLVAAVTSAKDAAESALQTIQATPSFSCNSDGPKADVQTFLNARLDKTDAYIKYRDAVKALVKAVKQAAESTSTTEGGK